MRKKFKMKELDCAHCAGKMEEGIKKIEGVKDASISFMTQKLTIECDDDKFEAVINEAQRIVKSIEPDCSIEF
jgi:copper chaperone CopZ